MIVDERGPVDQSHAIGLPLGESPQDRVDPQVEIPEIRTPRVHENHLTLTGPLQETVEIRLERRGIENVVRREIEDDDLVIGPERRLQDFQTLARFPPEAGGDVVAWKGLVRPAEKRVRVADDQDVAVARDVYLAKHESIRRLSFRARERRLPSPPSTASSPRSSAPTTSGASPTPGSRSTSSTTPTTSPPASRSGSASPAPTRSRAASTTACTATGSGRCASTPASPAPRTRTSATAT